MFCNFEYEVHVTEKGRPYVRGFLESITAKPKYDVFDFDLDAYDVVLVESDIKKTIENVENINGYTIRINEFFQRGTEEIKIDSNAMYKIDSNAIYTVKELEKLKDTGIKFIEIEYDQL
jgi:hypothetical protein